jgi:hypothetical protein
MFYTKNICANQQLIRSYKNLKVNVLCVNENIDVYWDWYTNGNH